MMEVRAAEVKKMQEGTRRKTTSKILIKMNNGNAVEKVMNRMKEKTTEGKKTMEGKVNSQYFPG